MFLTMRKTDRQHYSEAMPLYRHSNSGNIYTWFMYSNEAVQILWPCWWCGWRRRREFSRGVCGSWAPSEHQAPQRSSCSWTEPAGGCAAYVLYVLRACQWANCHQLHTAWITTCLRVRIRLNIDQSIQNKRSNSPLVYESRGLLKPPALSIWKRWCN